jgi:hypothetical protein
MSRPEEEEGKGNVKVVCRFRPLNQKEIDLNLGSGIQFMPDGMTVKVIGQEKEGTHNFTFDAVFGTDSV